MKYLRVETEIVNEEEITNIHFIDEKIINIILLDQLKDVYLFGEDDLIGSGIEIDHYTPYASFFVKCDPEIRDAVFKELSDIVFANGRGNFSGFYRPPLD